MSEFDRYSGIDPESILGSDRDPNRRSREEHRGRGFDHERKLAEMLRDAEENLLAKAIDLIGRDDLVLNDIPSALLLKRLLLCGFQESSATSHQSIKALLSLKDVGKKDPQPGEDDASGVDVDGVLARRDRGGLV